MSNKEIKASKKKNVQVAVRVRPMNSGEIDAKGRPIVKVDYVAKSIGLKEKSGVKTFGPFDRVYGPETTQSELYKELVTPLVKEVMSGYNCTIFAYGQTGTGKTFTMEGQHDDSADHSWDTDPTAGIIPRCLHHVFTELERQELDEYSVRISYVELYNEELFDLLGSGNYDQSRLRIFEDPIRKGGVIINGMEEVPVRNRNEVYRLLKMGAERRKTAATLMNVSSSRSHSVFTVTVVMRENTTTGEELLKQGKLYLVDLAGSENIGRSGALNARAREAGNINQSLLTLGRVITSLTSNAPHIPYRESKLTRILQDSLGGKSITTIIATLSPCSSNFEESINTLEYAQRAKNIKNNPEVNQKLSRKALLREYNEEIERLRKDLMAAREKNGVFLAQENYEDMIEEQKEQKAKIEELEGHLEALMHRIQMYMQDLSILDEHYQIVFDKCRSALAKLEIRNKEIEETKMELDKTQQNLMATQHALQESEDAGVRLRAQAVELKELYHITSHDLNSIHDKLDIYKETFNKNEHLLGNFSAERIHEITKAKTEIQSYTKNATEGLGRIKQTGDSLKTRTLEDLQKAVDLVETWQSSAQSFASTMENMFSQLKSDDEHIKEKLCSQFENQMNILNNMHSQMGDCLKRAMDSTASVLTESNSFVATQQLCTEKYSDERKRKHSEFLELTKKFESFLHELRNHENSVEEEATTFSHGQSKHVTEFVTKLTGTCSGLTSTLDSATNSNYNTAKALKEIVNSHSEYQTESKRVLDNAVGNAHEVSNKFVSNQTKNKLEHTCLTNETKQCIEEHCESLASGIHAQNKSCDALSHSLTVHLQQTQTAIEKFVHQEIQRVHSTGKTPTREPQSFDEELIDIPISTDLIQDFHSCQTPVRKSFYRVRESLLDEVQNILVSPQTLHKTLATKLEVIEEGGSENSSALKEINKSCD